MTELYQGMFLGDINDASSSILYEAQRFTLIVNCTKDIPFFYNKDDLTHLRAPVDDIGNPRDVEDLARLIPKIVDEVEMHLARDGKVLIHCRAGRQRSAAVATACLMRFLGIGRDEAIRKTKSLKRDAFFPNTNFIDSLPGKSI
jgi:predicted protein tyrosine phosphatase